jgi:hypothetical protein
VEFFKAWEIYRSDVVQVEATAHGDLHHHRHDEFQPVIPWQVALQQSLPPLHRLETIVRQFLTLRKLHFDQQKGDISNVAK